MHVRGTTGVQLRHRRQRRAAVEHGAHVRDLTGVQGRNTGQRQTVVEQTVQRRSDDFHRHGDFRNGLVSLADTHNPSAQGVIGNPRGDTDSEDELVAARGECGGAAEQQPHVPVAARLPRGGIAD